MAIAKSPRLYVTNDLAAGQSLTLTDDRAHYLLHVMRLKKGDDLRLFNGRDGQWHGLISDVKKRSVEVSLREQLLPQKALRDLWLCCAPIKKAHFEYMIEKATELGVSSVQPVLTARTQIREVNKQRCTLIMTEAAEQSERMTVPLMEQPVTLSSAVATWPEDRTLIVCAEFGEAPHIQKVFQSPALLSAKKVAIMTGPEGGFTAEELGTLRSLKSAIFVRLGPRILRADTAAISALSCWQALCGEWKNNGPIPI